jgi:hypothetical protein
MFICMKIVFVFAQIHSAHVNFANGINADKIQIGTYKKKINIPNWYIRGILKIPKNYDVYITEDPGFRVIIPIIKLFNKKSKFFTIITYKKPYQIFLSREAKKRKIYKKSR